MEIIRTIAVITGIGVFLAALLTLAERYLLNYGICKITINNDKEIQVNGGNHLLGSLVEQGIFIPSACGGRGSCGLCKVKVLDGGGPILPTETPYLTRQEIQDNVRLSCQVRVRQDIKIEIPEAFFNIREYPVTVKRIIDMTHDIKSLHLQFQGSDTMDFAAGQYVQIKAPKYGKNREEVYRAYSIASPQTQKNGLELIIRRVPEGICTTYVFDYLKEGDTLYLNGPHGDFYLRDSDKEIICIAGGSGLAPIKSILHKIEEEGIDRKTTFFFGCVGKKDLYYVEKMKDFEEKIPGFKFVPALSSPVEDDEWSGETGLITEVVDRYVSSGINAEAYLCGSPGMIDACIKVLNSKGIDDEYIYYDKF